MAYHPPIDELTTTDTPRGPGPRVVLGEAEPDGWLRFVLEGEGADIVGHATSDEELARVLRGVVPDVIVLDAGISATAALDAREHADGAAIVVVWPSGVASVVAEERVDPARVVEDLGGTVRSAAARTDASIPDDEGHVPDPVEPSSPFEDEPAGSPAERRRASSLPVAVASWVVYLTFVAAIASAVPKAFEPPPTPGGMRETRQTASPVADPAGGDGPAPEAPGTIDPRDGMGPLGDTGAEPGGSNGRDPGGRPGVPGDQQQQAPTQGDGRGQGGHGDQSDQDEPGDDDEDGRQGKGGGRPEDPGSQGQGGGRPEDPGSQGQGNHGGRAEGKGTNTKGGQDDVVDPGTRPGPDRRPGATSVTRPSAA